jgi:hypothetical protein
MKNGIIAFCITILFIISFAFWDEYPAIKLIFSWAFIIFTFYILYKFIKSILDTI